MKKTTLFILIAVLSWLSGCTSIGHQSGSLPNDAPLFKTISSLDQQVFDTFNHCEVSEQLQKHAIYFSSDVEFYHDTGGVTWTRQEMLANTEKYVCGKFQRELIANSLEVFPIKGFGAIEQGTHRFCQLATHTCDGIANFIIIWRHQNDQWQITRVISYGHRPNR